MNDQFIFWAQALDNSSPDHIEVHGEDLPVDDEVRRQEAVSLVSKAVKTGARICKARGIQFKVDAHHFVLEVPSAQLDQAGRTAPIVCYGNYDHDVADALGSSVVDGLRAFAKRIGRSLQPEHSELVRNSFAELKKKISQRRRVRQATIGAITLALIILGYWLASRR